MQADGVPPTVTLYQKLTATWVAQAISVVAKLGTADALADGPKGVDELAVAANAHAPALYRILRALASVGIFAEEEDGRFCLTPLAEPLRSDAPGSVRSFAIMLGEEWSWRPWGQLLQSVTTGQPAFEHTYGTGIFAYLADRPDAGAIFDAAMTSRSGPDADAVTAAYDFSAFRTVVDVGGGRGALLAAILRTNPDVRGILFDQAHVIPGARQYLDAAGLGQRCELVAGDFFASVVAGGDTYVLKWIVHDWDDERALRILERCHRAMPATGRLLLVETVIPPGNDPSSGKLADLAMLVWTGGQERTEAEYRALLAAAGFELTKVVPTRSSLSVVEAVPR
ncbi:MAG: methyltransferase [Chloroflexi bacterium]|nr:methyltransferase [Chloroflexota bacterium]